MRTGTWYGLRIALFVGFGGFLMGFDASVISGVVTFIEPRFGLNKIELGWAVASLTLTATIAMMCAGPLSDRFGRRPVLRLAALLFAGSAVLSAVAPNLLWLVIARMIGGFGVGAALIIAPMYIAEMSPAALRGRMVSINQLNIVVGISAAFFSNYFILELGYSNEGWLAPRVQGDAAWRWMLGIEALPSVLYFVVLYFVPESPRWLVMHGRERKPARSWAASRMRRRRASTSMPCALRSRIAANRTASRSGNSWRPPCGSYSRSASSSQCCSRLRHQRRVLLCADDFRTVRYRHRCVIHAGGTGRAHESPVHHRRDPADRSRGRRPLLATGLVGIVVSMFALAWGFADARYRLDDKAVAQLPAEVEALAPLAGHSFADDIAFREAVTAAIGHPAWQQHKAALVGPRST